jgi:hypothetical protein
MVSVSAHSAGAYTATLLVMVNHVMNGGGRAPPPVLAWANFTLMMECTPESSRCYSVYSVVRSPEFIWAPCALLYSLTRTPPPPPRIWALLVSQDRRHLFVTLWLKLILAKCVSEQNKHGEKTVEFQNNVLRTTQKSVSRKNVA